MTTRAQELLTQIKELTGWSQPKLALEIGTSQPTINRLLKGQSECKASTWLAIEDLGRRLGVVAQKRSTRRKGNRLSHKDSQPQ